MTRSWKHFSSSFFIPILQNPRIMDNSRPLQNSLWPGMVVLCSLPLLQCRISPFEETNFAIKGKEPTREVPYKVPNEWPIYPVRALVCCQKIPPIISLKTKSPSALDHIPRLLFCCNALMMHTDLEPVWNVPHFQTPGLAQWRWKGIAFANVSLPHPSLLLQTMHIRGSAIGVIYFSLMLL